MTSKTDFLSLAWSFLEQPTTVHSRNHCEIDQRLHARVTHRNHDHRLQKQWGMDTTYPSGASFESTIGARRTITAHNTTAKS